MGTQRRVLVAALVAVVGCATFGCTSEEEQIAGFSQRAGEYYEEEKWNEAKIEFLNLLKLDPDNADAHYKMGETLWELTEYREALWQYKEAVRLDPSQTEWRLKVAQVEFAAKRYDDSLENIDQVLAADPNSVDALLLRGGLRSVKGDSSGLLEDVDRALEIDPNHVPAVALKAQALSRLGDVDGAEKFLRHLNTIDPTTENRTALARFLASLRRTPEALKAFEEAIEIADGDEERNRARLFLANFHINSRDPDKAEEVLLKARGESPGDSTILLSLAQFYYLNGDREKAEAMLEENAASSDEIGPHIVLADFHRRLGHKEKALTAIDRALEIDPDSEEAKLRKAEAIMDARDDDDTASERAWAIVREVLDVNPNSTLGTFTEGKFYLIEEKFDEATTSLRRVINEQPSANAHGLLGAAYIQTDQLELARSEFLQALQLDAQNQFARMQLSGLYLRMGERELAAQEAEIALQRSPDVRMRLVRAEALAGLGRVHEAREELKRIQEADKEAFRVRLQIARLYRRTHDVATASTMLDGLLAEDPNDFKVRNTIMSEIVLNDVQARDPKGAIRRLDGWIEADPNNASLYEMRGRVRMGYKRGGRLDQPDLAEADLRAAVDRRQFVSAYMLLAQLYLETKREDKALATYQEARERHPNDASVAFALAGLYEQREEIPEARKYYEIVLQLDQSQAIAKNNLAWLIANADEASEEELDRALQLAQDAKEALPDNPSVADTLGWVMYKKKIPSAAISLFREAIEGYPEAHPLRGTVRFHLAKSYESNGEPDRAIKELVKALDEVPSFAERRAAEGLLRELRTN